MIHLYLVRHGTTQAIENRLMEGRLDSPLSPRGREEAVLTAQALQNSDIEYVFCSPLKRTRDTAEIICGQLGLEYQIINELREMNFGIFEGKTYFEVPDQNSSLFERIFLMACIMAAQISGEPIFRVARRAQSAWNEISRQVKDEGVLVITHGVLINYLIKLLLPVEAYDRIKPVRTDPCSISELAVIRPGDAQPLRMNDTSHLDPLSAID